MTQLTTDNSTPHEATAANDRIDAIARTKRRMALASLGVASVFLGLKAWAAWVSGSTGVLAMAVEAFLDVTSALATFIVVRHADRPPDRDHPYGHGRYEQGAALFQAAVMFVMAAGLVYESVARWLAHHALESLGTGMGVLAVTACGGLGWGTVMLRRARQTGSPALRAYGRMVVADCVSDAAVLVTLGLYGLTGRIEWDVGISLVVAGTIFTEATKSVAAAWRDFTDHRLETDEEQEIVDLCEEFRFVRGIHDLRTRTSGGYRMVDMHARFCRSLTLHEAHFLAERLSRYVEQRFPRSNVLVHADPCEQCTAPDCRNWQTSGEPMRMRVSIDKALMAAGGDLAKAAAELGLSKDDLDTRLGKLGIDPDIYKRDA